MHALELKVPPPLVGLLVALVMWVAALFSTPFYAPFAVRVLVAIIFVVVGVGISAAGIHAFQRAQTTTNPLKPDTTSALVVSGIYRITRNPMYLGVLIVLLGWAFFLSNILAFLCAFIFLLYMNRFQIGPEEKALSRMFGAQFDAYKVKVRRWL